MISSSPLRRVLLVARWPVGGIRTYLQRMLLDESFADIDVSVLLPDVQESRILERALMARRINWIFSRESTRSLAVQAAKTIMQCRPALVHSHGFTSAVCAGPACVLTSIPHLTTVHDVFLETQFSGLTGTIRRVVTELGLRSSDAIHFVSYDSRANTMEFMPRVLQGRTASFVVPHGVDTERLDSARERDLHASLDVPRHVKLIGFCGRFMAQKGFRVLVDAVLRLKAQDVQLPAFKVVAVGSGGYIREDQQYVENRGVRDLFHFEPLQPEIGPTLKALDVLVMPSRWEASGLLAMEALVVGVPLIGTSCIGLRETLAGTPARMVIPGDAEALAKAIAEELVESTKASSRAFMTAAKSRFDQHVAYRSVRKIYDELGVGTGKFL